MKKRHLYGGDSKCVTHTNSCHHTNSYRYTALETARGSVVLSRAFVVAAANKGSHMKKPTQVMAGPVEVTEGADIPSRIAALIWGPSGAGKTTFAATAPGKKLWFSFGDQEHVSVAKRKDVKVANVSQLRYEELFRHCQNDNPFGLEQILDQDESIETVVVDSCTAIAFRALQKAVEGGYGKSTNFRPTMEMPGLSAYGARNAIVLEVVTGFLRVTSEFNVHCILTAHEADPTYVKGKGREEGIIDHIGMMLGGQLVNNNAWRLSEIWYMSQMETGEKHRRLAVRPTRLRRPMKSRMFSSMGDPEFTVLYNAEKPDKGQMTIAGFYEQWKKGGMEKLPVPKRK